MHMVPVFIRSTGILINIWLYNVVFLSCSSLSLPIPNLFSDSVEPPLPCNFVPLFPGPATRSSKLPLNESSILPLPPLCDYPAQPSLYPSPTLDPSFSLGVQVFPSPTIRTPFPFGAVTTPLPYCSPPIPNRSSRDTDSRHQSTHRNYGLPHCCIQTPFLRHAAHAS